MTNEAREIIVNTATDDNDPKNSLKSLREAIDEANTNTLNEKVYINFNLNESESESKSSQKTSSKLNWNIKPSAPLPALTARNVFINYTNPKNITINGEKLSQSKGRTYSLITIGNYTNIGSTSTNKPSVRIKNINLVNNKISGENGSNGGGGGLAAGAGLSVLHGDVTLNNVVFQNLTATGGKGSKAPDGAKPTYRWIKPHNRPVLKGWYPENGKAGGPGGRPTLLGADTSSSGGGGGASGTERRHDTSGAKGGNGSNGAFGVGGAGGGGGGGGAMVRGQRCLVEIFCKRTSDKYGEGGPGGNGGQGGFGAGGGAGGTAGENAFGLVKVKKFKPGGSGGEGGSPHGNNSGSKGNRNYGGNGTKVSTGRRGGEGAALGAAVAILNPNSKVVLNNVDFIGNKAISKAGSFDNIYMISGSPGGTLFGNSLYIYDDYNGANRRDIQLNKTLNDNSNYAKIADSSGLTPEAPKNIHRAVSLERDDKVARIRDQTINHQPGTADITTIQVERPSSTLRPIDIDSSALEASINNLYKRVIPVEDEATIKNRFKERILSGFISAASGGYASYSNAESFFKASENKYNAETQSSAIKMGAALAGAGFLKSIWDAHKSYKSEIEQNKRNLKELNRLQKVNRAVTAGPIDIGQSRSVITIKNFTIGEDTIYLDDFWSSDLEDYSPIILNGMGRTNDEKVETFEIHLKTSSNAPTKVAEVQLDPKSVKRLNTAIQQNPTGYINALLKPNTEKKQWEIGTKLTDKNRIIQSSDQYTGGPAGEIRILERQNLGNLTDVWTIDTFNYDDRIFGSKGSEKIITNGGNDFIEPSYGADTVNGGESIDWVNYADLKEPIQAKGSLVITELEQKVNTITINNSANTDRNQILKTTLENIEVISSFGASSFNFSAAPQPNPLSLAGTSDELPGFYAMRSGSGSTIQGSPFDDRIIISMMEDENSSNYTDSKQQDNPNANQKILSKPSVITGNTGNDHLTFAFSDQAPELSITNVDDDGEYKDFKAVINKTTNTVIAFFKGIDASRVKAIHEVDTPSTPINIDAGSFQYTFDTTTTKELADTTQKENAENANDPKYSLDHDEDLFKGVIKGSKINTPTNTLSDTPFKVFAGKRGKAINDILVGSRGPDVLLGRQGNDRLIGKSGDDIFFGGVGRNHIKPGGGQDQIHLHRHGVQIIHGFNPLKDMLVMPKNFRENLLDFSDSKITYNNHLIAKIVDT